MLMEDNDENGILLKITGGFRDCKSQPRSPLVNDGRRLTYLLQVEPWGCLGLNMDPSTLWAQSKEQWRGNLRKHNHMVNSPSSLVSRWGMRALRRWNRENAFAPGLYTPAFFAHRMG